MKKKLFFLAVAAVALASCSNDQVVSENTTTNQPKEITFFAVNQNTTRSATSHLAIDGTTFPTTLDMMVTAYDVTHTRDFFDATNFTYRNNILNGNPTANYWGGETPVYWPLSAANINFLAIANANDDNATNVTWGSTNKASDVTVVMADNYAYNTKQHDFMFAAGYGNVTQSGNNLGFPTFVPMIFKHAQAYLTFRVKAANDASTAIKIKNIEIYGARFAGTAKITNTNYASANSDATTLYWNPTTKTDSYKSVLDNQPASGFADEASSYPLTTSLVQKGQIMVVPNMTSADSYTNNGETKVKISYYLASKLYEYEYNLNSPTFEAGKKYIYDITFTLHEILIEPSVTNWVDETNYIDIPSPVYTNAASGAFNYPVSGTIAATAGTYTFDVKDLTSTTDVSVAGVAAGGDITALESVSHVYNTTTKVATVTFKVPASGGSAKKYQITVTDNGTSGSNNVNTITINQAAE